MELQCFDPRFERAKGQKSNFASLTLGHTLVTQMDPRATSYTITRDTPSATARACCSEAGVRIGAGGPAQ